MSLITLNNFFGSCEDWIVGALVSMVKLFYVISLLSNFSYLALKDGLKIDFSLLTGFYFTFPYSCKCNFSTIWFGLNALLMVTGLPKLQSSLALGTSLCINIFLAAREFPLLIML